MADHQSLGGRIRALRRQQGLSQAQLAGDGISPSYVSLVEAGKRIPSPEVVSKLAAKLKCPESELLSYLGRQQDDELELELRYAELALANGDAKHAVERFSALLDRVAPSGHAGLTVGATWGLAQGLNDPASSKRRFVCTSVCAPGPKGRGRSGWTGPRCSSRSAAVTANSVTSGARSMSASKRSRRSSSWLWSPAPRASS